MNVALVKWHSPFEDLIILSSASLLIGLYAAMLPHIAIGSWFGYACKSDISMRFESATQHGMQWLKLYKPALGENKDGSYFCQKKTLFILSIPY